MCLLKVVFVAASALSFVGCATNLGPITPGNLRVIAGSEIPLADRADMHSRKDNEAWMLLTFSSDDNYLDVAAGKQMHVSVNESLCTDGHLVRDIMSSSLLAGPPPPSLVSDVSAATVRPRRHVYYTYFAMAAPKRAAVGADPGPAEGYDLHSETRDLCIQVRGGNMIGMTVESGIAVFANASVRGVVVSNHSSP
ncbi:hypothetical protein [Luteibacter aegosomatissinici]|uniref:hypothetical protein n=1 Tax=Luteibacter aegosomatissinici TaxID=2911539 RepID=UPI001FFBEFE7|nr:hypothetical protein [Luteibacter aegosomatissinici]UPG95092.1 hypothetical protein L2Y97_03010 [Luteibacter aegosomatissinici]